MSENGEIYTADKNFTLPPTLTAVTNLTSDSNKCWLQNTPSGEGKSRAFIKEPGGKSFW